jgi:hypothetical protein
MAKSNPKTAVGSKLIDLAEELTRVKNSLPLAARKVASAEAQLVTVKQTLSSMVCRHKELQAEIATEALLVKPE